METQKIKSSQKILSILRKEKLLSKSIIHRSEAAVITSDAVNRTRQEKTQIYKPIFGSINNYHALLDSSEIEDLNAVFTKMKSAQKQPWKTQNRKEELKNAEQNKKKKMLFQGNMGKVRQNYLKEKEVERKREKMLEQMKKKGYKPPSENIQLEESDQRILDYLGDSYHNHSKQSSKDASNNRHIVLQLIDYQANKTQLNRQSNNCQYQHRIARSLHDIKHTKAGNSSAVVDRSFQNFSRTNLNWSNVIQPHENTDPYYLTGGFARQSVISMKTNQPIVPYVKLLSLEEKVAGTVNGRLNNESKRKIEMALEKLDQFQNFDFTAESQKIKNEKRLQELHHSSSPSSKHATVKGNTVSLMKGGAVAPGNAGDQSKVQIAHLIRNKTLLDTSNHNVSSSPPHVTKSLVLNFVTPTPNQEAQNINLQETGIFQTPDMSTAVQNNNSASPYIENFENFNEDVDKNENINNLNNQENQKENEMNNNNSSSSHNNINIHIHNISLNNSNQRNNTGNISGILKPGKDYNENNNNRGREEAKNNGKQKKKEKKEQELRDFRLEKKIQGVQYNEVFDQLLEQDQNGVKNGVKIQSEEKKVVQKKATQEKPAIQQPSYLQETLSRRQQMADAIEEKTNKQNNIQVKESLYKRKKKDFTTDQNLSYKHQTSPEKIIQELKVYQADNERMKNVFKQFEKMEGKSKSPNAAAQQKEEASPSQKVKPNIVSTQELLKYMQTYLKELEESKAKRFCSLVKLSEKRESRLLTGCQNFISLKRDMNNSLLNHLKTVERDRPVTQQIRRSQYRPQVVQRENTLFQIRNRAEEERKKRVVPLEAQIQWYEKLLDRVSRFCDPKEDISICHIMMNEIQSILEDTYLVEKHHIINILEIIESDDSLLYTPTSFIMLGEIFKFFSFSHDQIFVFHKYREMNEEFTQSNQEQQQSTSVSTLQIEPVDSYGTLSTHQK